MKSRAIYFMSLLAVAVLAASSLIAAAQEDNGTMVNKTALNGTALMNPGLNFSATNKAVTDSIGPDKANAASTAPFAIGKASGTQNEKVTEASARESLGVNSGAKTPNRPAFVIHGYSRPVLNETGQDPSLLNAAYLSCRVGQTPHGYTTYYN